MSYLKEMKPNEKAVVYTSFLGMMDLICRELDEQMVTYRTIKGRDSSSKRGSIIDEFNSYESTKVLLITLKTGAVGLNLQAANKVFFMTHGGIQLRSNKLSEEFIGLGKQNKWKL